MKELRLSMSPRGLPVLKEVLRSLKCGKTNMPYYAVARGREVGVFQSWDVCQDLTANFKGAKYKKFESKDSAWDFVKQFRFKAGKPIVEESHEAPVAKQIKIEEAEIEDAAQEDASNSRFDFAAFNVRLTNLENSYQEKIRSLEERIKALEDERTTSNDEKDGSKNEGSKGGDDGSKPGTSRISAAKRKLLETAGDFIKPGSSRQYSTSALKRMKPSEEEARDIASSECSESLGKSVPFKVTSDDYVMVYTDGACSKNGYGIGRAKAGIGVWFNDGHPLNVSAAVKGRPTNNVAELQAATVAAEMAAGVGIRKLCIVTDSQFAINCITSWIKNWKRNDWKTSKGEPVINKNEVLELEKACSALEDVKWEHVKGHGGNHGNEQADQLARNGAEQYDHVKDFL